MTTALPFASLSPVVNGVTATTTSVTKRSFCSPLPFHRYGDRAEVPLNLINPATNRNEDDKAKRATADPQDAEHPDEPDLPPFWVAKEIGERERYFFNTLTNETSWEHPGLKGTANELDNIDTANFEMTAQGDEGVAVSGPPAVRTAERPTFFVVSPAFM